MDGAVTYMLSATGDHEAGVAARDWFAGGPLAGLSRLPGLLALDLYTPGVAQDPFLDDGPGPALMAHAYFATAADLAGALNSAEFPAAALRDGPAAGIRITHEAMKAEYFPVAGARSAASLDAPVSYLVHYHRPAQDEAQFIDHYIKVHPPVLGRFPRIRNVICYYPLHPGDGWVDPSGIPHADYMLANEVVFDNLADLNAALASEARRELRRDYHEFPPFSGRNTHYPMSRTRHISPASGSLS